VLYRIVNLAYVFIQKDANSYRTCINPYDHRAPLAVLALGLDALALACRRPRRWRYSRASRRLAKLVLQALASGSTRLAKLVLQALASGSTRLAKLAL
jgi:hypothetical protein